MSQGWFRMPQKRNSSRELGWKAKRWGGGIKRPPSEAKPCLNCIGSSIATFMGCCSSEEAVVPCACTLDNVPTPSMQLAGYRCIGVRLPLYVYRHVSCTWYQAWTLSRSNPLSARRNIDYQVKNNNTFKELGTIVAQYAKYTTASR